MRTILIPCIFVALLLLANCRDDVPQSQKKHFVGEWIINTVVHDNTDQPAWKGKQIIFTQHNDHAGTYTLTNPPNDSIWAASGNWTMKGNGEILREDSVVVFYHTSPQADELYLSMHLPWTTRPCTEPICLGIVTGQWNMVLTRKL